MLLHRCPAPGCNAAYAAKSSLSTHKAKNHPELVQTNGGARAGCGRERVRPLKDPNAEKLPRGRRPKVKPVEAI